MTKFPKFEINNATAEYKHIFTLRDHELYFLILAPNTQSYLIINSCTMVFILYYGCDFQLNFESLYAMFCT